MADRGRTAESDVQDLDSQLAEAERQEKIARIAFLRQQTASYSCIATTPTTQPRPTIVDGVERPGTDRVPPPRFDGKHESFAAWAPAAASWFTNRGFAGIVGIDLDGSPTPSIPDLEATAREILLFQMVDKTVLIGDNLLYAGTSAQCWRALFRMLRPCTFSSVIRASKDLFSVRQQAGESVALYAARLQAAAQLFRTTVPNDMLHMTDSFLAVLMAGNASSELDTAASNLHSRGLEPRPTVTEVVSTLTSEEQRIQEAHADREISFATANSASATAHPIKAPERDGLCVLHTTLRKPHTNGNCFLQRSLWRTTSNTSSQPDQYVPVRAMSARHPAVDNSSVGLLDSGCSTTMTPLREHLGAYRHVAGPTVELADLSRTTTSGRGVTSLGADQSQMAPIDSLHVPRLGQALVSVGQITRSGHKIVFDGPNATIYSKDNWTSPVGTPLAVSTRGADNLYRIALRAPAAPSSTEIYSSAAPSVSCRAATVASASPALWHERVGHLGYVNLRLLQRRCRGMAFDQPIPKLQDRCPCEACLLTKGKRSSFPPSTSRARRVSDLVHSDLSGRWPVVGIGGFEYYQTMLDDSTRYLTVYLLRRKSDALDVIKHYDARLRNQEGRGISDLQTDGGGEFNSKACVTFYNESGILHRKSVPYTPKQNGRAEIVNYSLCCIEGAIRCHARMPDFTWPWSLSYSAVLYNVHPRSVLPGRRSSFQAARFAKPDVSSLRVYGCDAYAMRPHPSSKKPTKLDHRGVRAVFIGFTPGMKAWRFYDVERGDTFESTTAEFLETSFTFGFRRSNSGLESSQAAPVLAASSLSTVAVLTSSPAAADAVIPPLPSASPVPVSSNVVSSPSSDRLQPSAHNHHAPLPDLAGNVGHSGNDAAVDADNHDGNRASSIVDADVKDHQEAGNDADADSPADMDIDAAQPSANDGADSPADMDIAADAANDGDDSPADMDIAADVVADDDVLDMPHPRRSTRHRQPPGEWWKGPAKANRSSTRWASTVDTWFQHPVLTAPIQRPPRPSRRQIHHWQQVEERRLIREAIRSHRPAARG
ncbi:hypothetical protein PBRA_009598 [Plasmodiophora brassicae]|uniref:Integrase catalytic domain-containing protein n=1 Tax=Plasmodiophora brassicae TaxID=37360 RepID=A0A0G4IIP1_PLABS|nr:hypothetical protein PBRA_009598 [Plasmodiophora brassicae]